MSARDIIKRAFEAEFADTYSGDAFADKCVAILHEEGHRILASGELDGVSLEAAAKVVAAKADAVLAQEAWDPDDDDYNCDAYEEAEYVAGVLGNCAAAIRALKAPPTETDGEAKQE